MTDKKEPTLLNWPPSRGPKPDWMTRGPEITVPAVTLLTSERLRPPTMVDEERADIEKALDGKGIGEIVADGRGETFPLDPERGKDDTRQTYHLAMNTHLASVASLDLRTAQRVVTAFDEEEHRCVSLLPTRTYRAKLIYPLNVDVMISIPPVTVTHARRPGRPKRTPKPHVDVGYLVWVIAKTYAETIYKDWKRFGVWGHAIEDLWFESLHIEGEKLDMFLGS